MRCRLRLITAASWLLASGCSSDRASTATSPTFTSPLPSISATVAASAAPTSSDPSNGTGTSPSAGVTAVVETTFVVATAGLELRADGLGDLDFGTAPDVLIKAINGALGPALTDNTSEFAAEVADSFENDETLQTFTSPFGRIVCWPGLCVQLGGDDSAALSFVGWEVFTDPSAATAPLTTVDGVTLGSRWSDFVDVMVVQPGGCPTTGLGTTTGGIELALDGGQFSTTSDSGEYVELLPDPSQVTVVGMQAGSQVVSLEEAC